MTQLVYSSLMVVSDHMLLTTVDEIVSRSARANRKLEITGCILFSGRRVVQFLEGPESSVHSLYERIKTDPRHREVTTLYSAHAKNREAKNWPMALCNVDKITEGAEHVRGFFDLALQEFKFHMDDFKVLMENYLFEEINVQERRI